MKLFLICALVGLAAASQVTELRIETLNRFINDAADKGGYLQIYAPWCGYCKKLAPTYEELAAELGDKHPVAKIDGVKYSQDIMGVLPFEGFPSIFFVKKGKAYEFRDSNRTVATFVEFMDERVYTRERPVELTDLPETDVSFSGLDAMISVNSDATLQAVLDEPTQRTTVFVTCEETSNFCQQALNLFKKLSLEDNVRVVFASTALESDEYFVRRFHPVEKRQIIAGVLKGNVLYKFHYKLREDDVRAAIKAGKTDNPVPFPGPVPAVSKVIDTIIRGVRMINDDFETLMSFKKAVLAVVAGVSAFVGMLFGFLICVVCGRSSSNDKRKRE